MELHDINMENSIQVLDCLKTRTSYEYFDFDYKSNKIYSHVFEVLIEDTFFQYNKIFKAFNNLQMNEQKEIYDYNAYFKQFEHKDCKSQTNDSLYSAINTYCNIDFINSYDDKHDMIDYFSDLYIFEHFNKP